MVSDLGLEFFSAILEFVVRLGIVASLDEDTFQLGFKRNMTSESQHDMSEDTEEKEADLQRHPTEQLLNWLGVSYGISMEEKASVVKDPRNEQSCVTSICSMDLSRVWFQAIPDIMTLSGLIP